MKRAQDKIKDFVEPQAFDEVQNYSHDPARALAAYHFTDATSDLLARWLDALADLPRGRGAARALAGLRGVGKSHTLAAFGALSAQPELRSTVTDAHVATSARRLLGRRYQVAYIERGTRETLLEEIGAALSDIFGGEGSWPDDPVQMLAVAAGHAVDSTLVLIIDTAFGRETRVKRDDGPLLSQLVQATQHVSAFLALALDDDIEGADGANAALASSYQIDYLDPEHLYRVADLHLFQKNAQSRAALHDIYVALRNVVPGFNWSEPRFTAIYPVHPLVADVASAVRLYAPTFSFLPFAAGAATRATNRPALSLIVLDEVFDRAEYELRKSEELKDAFAAYDQLATKTITQIPIMQRLQAKLILKGLFIISLDGRGATARELGAAMLIYDEAKPEEAIGRVESMLASFADNGAPGSLIRSEDGVEHRYRFKISTTAAFDDALAEAVEALPSELSAIEELLRTIARGRFEDWPLTDAGEQTDVASDFVIMWRGMGRLGQFKWLPEVYDEHHDGHAHSDAETFPYDWEIKLLAPASAESEDESNAAAPSLDATSQANANEDDSQDTTIRAAWQPAKLKTEELAAIRRLVALRSNNALFNEFGETARAAERTHRALVERIWARAYMDDGALLIGGKAHAFTDEARAASSLADALGEMFALHFGMHYPLHPVFSEPIGESEVARLVSGLFGGANQSEASVQELARLFAAPLGLVSTRGDLYVLEAGDSILKQPWVREVLAMTDAADGEAVPLEAVYRKLRREPYGFSRETQHLILAALVAGRRAELVTATGDRIGRRTLDLKLRWDEVSGVARAAALLHSAEELTAWARRLTGQEALASIADPAARGEVRVALSRWLDEWNAQRRLEKFDALPDEGLTTRAWQLASAVRKSFGASAEAVETALSDTISLEEGLQRVADAFADSTEQFIRSTEQLNALTSFVEGLEERERVRAYLATAEPTGTSQIEAARRELLRIADDVHNLFDTDSNRRFDLLWREFHARYLEHYAARHDAAVGLAADRRKVDALVRDEGWREFETLSQLSIVNKQHWEEAARLLESSRGSQCKLPVRQLLALRPSCACAFRLSRAAALAAIPRALEETMRAGLEASQRTLMLWSKPLAEALRTLAESEQETKDALRARELAGLLAEGTKLAALTLADVERIERALAGASLPPFRVNLPREGYGLLTRDELQARLNQWLSDLPEYPALVEIVGESVDD
jgi:hypothetical protein